MFPPSADGRRIVQRAGSLADNVLVSLTFHSRRRAAAAFLAAAAILLTFAPSRAGQEPPSHRVPFQADFEDAERRPWVLPPAWDDVSRLQGYSGFGLISLEKERANSGRWSFTFRLEGDSLIAASGAGRIPVFPRVDYTVSTMVSTKGFDRARVRITAVMLDTAGKEINGTHVTSRLLNAERGFTEVELLVRGADRAAEMRVELQALQPRHQTAILPDRPQLDDLDGVAFFDDVEVRQRPTIRMSTAPLDRRSSVNAVFILPKQPVLHIEIRDLSATPSNTRLVVHDIDGNSVHEGPLPAGASSGPIQVPLSIERAGWYRATLEMHGTSEVIGRHSLAFVVLPQSSFGYAMNGTILGVRVPPLSSQQAESLPTTLELLGARSVHFDLWTRDAPAMFSNTRLNALRRAIERLLTREYQLTFSFREIPLELAGALALDPPQILDLLASPPERWRPHLDPILVNFALRVPRWSFGHANLPPEAYERFLPTIRQHLEPLIPSPRCLAPMHAEREGPDLAGVADPLVVLPSAAAPDSIESWMPLWPEIANGVVHLETRDDSPRVQALDLIMRGLYAWRAGLPELTIDAPWTWNGDIEPTPAFLAWRGLSDLLRGRRFAGELPLGPGRHGWLLEGAGRKDHGLLVFRDDQPGPSPDAIDLVLGNGPLIRRDAFGNAESISPNLGRHRVAITDLPAVVDGINLNLARFRASFAIAPTELPASHQVHERELTLTNPWPVPISGQLSIVPLPGFEFSPSIIPFSIPAGGTFRGKLSVIFRRGIIAGPRPLLANVDVRADQEYRVQLSSKIDVGWKNIQIGAAWRIAVNRETGTNDLMVQLTCTNRGTESVDLEAFAAAPGVRRLRRALRTLAPGETAQATFVIADGVSQLAGQSLRYGVAERSGAATLSQRIDIPVLTAAVPTP